ncbi:glutathione synthetase ATP-binding domain-like protein [Aspergillus costaricaensis CBS 115574]|uniref:Glutathione synthetase ATP-binding domain-like protein n=1 Tax=Aspergillus costaricaensis CBS 115574 TaxID=1448317 RepID=A0ACD1ITR0_9EURO|nr:glutathione synthetase ATP-binding domain-like protein [Aspergillus costaricaensis CBS 115574]RAK94088.1 glutathione synthetase ATP-binding domain-like protein [Aspergillus costaricaensis CBS 115574]
MFLSTASVPRVASRLSRPIGFGESLRRANHTQSPRVAVLFQAIDPPIIGGVRKPRKPGGYQDSGADIAYTLQSKGIRSITPKPSPQLEVDQGWCFADTEEGIESALSKGATHLWANTILFNAHPLQSSQKLSRHASEVYVVGQPPALVENFDDKAYLNGKLGQLGGFTLPKSWLASDTATLENCLSSISRYPVVGKPVRGRGSHGVKVCHDPVGLKDHVQKLLQESPLVMIEEYLPGEEATITVMPPSPEVSEYWSMPPVARFNHADGIAPYNGVVAVSSNSRVVTESEMKDPAYHKIMDECVRVAKLIKATAPIRVDVRRFCEGSEFALFDINMKPNMTGPGRPGRESQASLTAIAAAALGWDYGTLLKQILATAQPLASFRSYRSPF